jgi:hypothetical protein
MAGDETQTQTAVRITVIHCTFQYWHREIRVTYGDMKETVQEPMVAVTTTGLEILRHWIANMPSAHQRMFLTSSEVNVAQHTENITSWCRLPNTTSVTKASYRANTIHRSENRVLT